MKGFSMWVVGAFGVAGSAIAMWWQRRRLRAPAPAVVGGGVAAGPAPALRAAPPAASPAAALPATPLAVHRSSGSMPAQPTPPGGAPARRRPVARHAPYVESSLPPAVAALPLFSGVPRHFTRALLVSGDGCQELCVVDYTSADLRAPARRCVTLAILHGCGGSLGEGLVDLMTSSAIAAMPEPVREALGRARPLAAQGRGEWLVVFPADGRPVADEQLEGFAADARALHTLLADPGLRPLA